VRGEPVDGVCEGGSALRNVMNGQYMRRERFPIHDDMDAVGNDRSLALHDERSFAASKSIA